MAETIQDQLRAWGRARPLNCPPNWFAKPGWVEQIQSAGDNADKSDKPLPISDELHSRIDRAVGEMKNLKPEHFQIIVYVYRLGYSDYRIARYSRWLGGDGEPESRSRSWVRAMRENAEHWLEARILE